MLRGIIARKAAGEVVELHLRERVDVGRLRRLVDLVHACGDSVGRGGGSVDDPGLATLEVIEEIAERLDVVVGLPELVVVGRVGDRGEMENEVDLAAAKIMLQVEELHVGCDHVALEALEILERTGTKIVHDGQVRLGITPGHFVDQVRSDKAGPAGDDDVFVHNIYL